MHFLGNTLYVITGAVCEVLLQIVVPDFQVRDIGIGAQNLVEKSKSVISIMVSMITLFTRINTFVVLLSSKFMI